MQRTSFSGAYGRTPSDGVEVTTYRRRYETARLAMVIE